MCWSFSGWPPVPLNSSGRPWVTMDPAELLNRDVDPKTSPSWYGQHRLNVIICHDEPYQVLPTSIISVRTVHWKHGGFNGFTIVYHISEVGFCMKLDLKNIQTITPISQQQCQRHRDVGEIRQTRNGFKHLAGRRLRCGFRRSGPKSLRVARNHPEKKHAPNWERWLVIMGISGYTKLKWV